MIRINLLPPEIIERRKYERFYPYVFVVAGIMLAVVLAAWGFLQFLYSSRASELQSIQQTAADLQKQADSLAVFELKEQDLAKREEAAAKALAQRIDLGRVAEEMSLILPEEVWVTEVEMGQEPAPNLHVTRLKVLAQTPEPKSETVSQGFKSVASTLVRLASLDKTLYDIWLAEASADEFTEYQGLAIEDPLVNTVGFEVSGKLKIDGVIPRQGQ